MLAHTQCHECLFQFYWRIVTAILLCTLNAMSTWITIWRTCLCSSICSMSALDPEFVHFKALSTFVSPNSTRPALNTEFRPWICDYHGMGTEVTQFECHTLLHGLVRFSHHCTDSPCLHRLCWTSDSWRNHNLDRLFDPVTQTESNLLGRHQPHPPASTFVAPT